VTEHLSPAVEAERCPLVAGEGMASSERLTFKHEEGKKEIS